MHIDLHIGAPKAGSTAIQRFLRLNKSTLRSVGVGVIAGQNAGLFEAFRTTANAGLLNEATQLLTKLKESKREDFALRKLLISSEFLFQVTNEQAIRLLKNKLCGESSSVNILVFLRDALSSKRAMYSTAVSLGTATPYKHYRTPPFLYRSLDTPKLWERMFNGGTTVQVELYDRSRFSGGDIRRRFADLVMPRGEAGRISLKFDGDDANTSKTPAELEVLRALNTLNQRLASPYRGIIYKTFRDRWLEIAKAELTLPPCSWSEPDLDVLLDKTREQNIAVVNEYFPSLSTEWFSDQALNYIARLDIDDDALLHVYNESLALLESLVGKQPHYLNF